MTDADFRINGVLLAIDEPRPFIDQAHGVLECLIAAVEDRGEAGPLNASLLAAATRGVATLVALAGLGEERFAARQAAKRRT